MDNAYQGMENGIKPILHSLLAVYTLLMTASELGLEYFILQRQSTLKYKGLGQRLQFGASYKF